MTASPSVARTTCAVSLVLMGAGCSDYHFKGNADVSEPGEVVDSGSISIDDDPVGAPLAVVSPGAVDLGVVCGSQTAEVTVGNDGDAALEVSAVTVDNSAFSVSHDPLPVTLQPGETLVLTVSGPGEAALVSVETTDPSHPTLEVPVSGELDLPPALSITGPADGSTLGVSSTTVFSATVSDDAGPADDVAIAWTSDVDGLLSNAGADGSGTTRFDWVASDRTSGTHTVTLSAVDTCGHRTEAQVVVCQNEGYLAENLDLATWNFEGDARFDSANGWVELTTPLTDQSGTAFQTAATVDSTNVSVDFAFYVSGGSGADGISVTALDVDRMSGFVGESGGGIGMGGLPGWSVEVDTYYNAADPTPDDHIALTYDGQAGSTVVWAPLPEMEDGLWHTMSLSVSGTWLTAAIDGTVYLDQDVPSLSSFPAYVGFTAATGSLTNDHLIDALQVEEYVCDG